VAPSGGDYEEVTDIAVARLIAVATDIAKPLIEAFEGPQSLAAFLAQMGWSIDDPGLDHALAAFGGLPATLTALASAAADLESALDTADTSSDTSSVAAAVTAAVPAIKAGVAVVQDLEAPAVTNGLPTQMTAPGFWTAFAEEVLDNLIFTYLQEKHPNLFVPLRLIGVLTKEPVKDGDPRIVDLKVVHWSQMVDLLERPEHSIQDLYGWGGSLNHIKLTQAVWEAAAALGLPVDTGEPSTDVLATYWDPPGPPEGTMQLRTPLWWLSALVGDTLIASKLSLLLAPIPASGHRDGAAVGVVLMPELIGAMGATVQLSDGITLEVSGNLQADGGIRLELRPRDVEARFGAAAEGTLRIALSRTAPAPTLVLVGSKNHTRVETGRAHVALEAHATGGETDVTFSLGAEQLALVLEPADLDGFLHNVMGDTPKRIDLSTTLRWSTRSGFTLGEQTSLKVDIPLDITIANVLKLTDAQIGLIGNGQHDTAAFRITIGAAVDIGPIHASISGVGAQIALHLPSNDGTPDLRDVSVRVGLVPPTQIGVAFNNPAVRGGGFLKIDESTGTYAGIVELTLANVVSVKAIGIITTKMPDGGKGFALLILITAEGFTPIQLGMGFALTGIGGLLALNRTVNADAIRGGLRNGILDSVLFVKDPVKNADRVLSTLDSIFPLARDRLVVGPLAEISWGTPTILTIRLAILLDLPQPVRVVILAALAAKLPKPDAAVVEIHVDAVGVLDLGKGQLALDASLHDSRILAFTLTGDLALRLNWGDDPGFLLSIGGFHPKYTPPTGLRPLSRLSLQLTDSNNPVVRFEAYFAITPSTLQFGARASIALEVAGFGVSGGGSFDALIQWSPFHLEVDLAAWVKITAGGATILSLNLALTVTGPQPWHLTGKAEFHVLFLSMSVPVDLTLGSSAAAADPVETVDATGLLWEQVTKSTSWQAALPARTSPGVTIAADGSAAAARPKVLAHPLAAVTIRQKVLPLGILITHVGGRVPAGGTQTYTLTITQESGPPAVPTADLFALAQFTDIPDEQKLSAPSFMPAQSGWTIASAADSSGPSTPCVAVVDTLEVTALDMPATVGAPAAALTPGLS
jgi:hypothetical protein